MNDGIIEELIMQMAALDKRLEYIETVEKNVFSTVTVAGVGQMLGLRLYGWTELTLSSNTNGVITRNRAVHTVDTYDDQAAGNLDTINGGTRGDILILSAVHDERTVNLIDNDDNLRLAGNMALDTIGDRIMLIYDGSYWYELARSNNG